MTRDSEMQNMARSLFSLVRLCKLLTKFGLVFPLCKTTEKKALKRDYTANLKYRYKERVYWPFDTLSSHQVMTHSQFRQPYSLNWLKY